VQWVAVAGFLGLVPLASLIAITWLGALTALVVRSGLLWMRWAREDDETRASLEAGG
jgi:hypothetical protein